MKLVIAGSRTLKPSFSFIWDAVKMLGVHDITEIVSGGAEGVDSEAVHFAGHMHVPFKLFKADWDSHGKSAGPIRNKKMAEYGDALLLIWDEESRGSKNMRDNMLLAGKPIYEVILKAPK